MPDPKRPAHLLEVTIKICIIHRRDGCLNDVCSHSCNYSAEIMVHRRRLELRILQREPLLQSGGRPPGPCDAHVKLHVRTASKWSVIGGWFLRIFGTWDYQASRRKVSPYKIFIDNGIGYIPYLSLYVLCDSFQTHSHGGVVPPSTPRHPRRIYSAEVSNRV